MLIPEYVTLTGASDDTDINQLIELSKRFPFVEWAILYSHERSADPKELRYPSINWISKLFSKVVTEDLPVNLALHLCGSSVTDFVRDNFKNEFINTLLYHERVRIQLNFSLTRVKFSIQELQHAVHRSSHSIITQHNSANAELIEHSFYFNHQILFDASGGRGVETEVWPSPIPEKMCGYAGGLGPENIAEQLVKIRQVACDPYWIDMESKLRTNDLLDLEKCISVLSTVERLNKEFSTSLRQNYC